MNHQRFAFHSLSIILTAAGVDSIGLASPAQRETAEIHLIGVQHAPGLFATEGLSPGHVRAALNAIDPDVVGVESNPEWFAQGHHYRVTYEAFAVAAPWAIERNRKVVGIDWIGDMRGYEGEQRLLRVREEARLLGSDAIDPQRFGYGPSLTEHVTWVAEGEITSFAHFNSAEFAAERIAWLDGGKHIADTPQAYIDVRDRHIAEHIAAAAIGADRMAVVIGAMHVGNVTRELRARGIDVKDLHQALAEKHIDLTKSADRFLTARDIAAILCISLDSGRATSADRQNALRQCLEELTKGQPQAVTDWLLYIKGRNAMLAGDVAEAHRAFDGLANSDGVTAFPYVGSIWRNQLTVQQAARFELGRIADLRGDRQTAIAEYQTLLKTIEVPAYTENEHSSYELLARAANAVRALTRQPYSHDLAFASQRPEVAAAPPLQAPAELQTAWDHLRNRRWPELREAIGKIKPSELAAAYQLEYHYIATISSIESGNVDQAQAMVKQLETQIAELPDDHWLKRELPGLHERIKAKTKSA